MCVAFGITKKTLVIFEEYPFQVNLRLTSDVRSFEWLKPSITLNGSDPKTSSSTYGSIFVNKNTTSGSRTSHEGIIYRVIPISKFYG